MVIVIFLVRHSGDGGLPWLRSDEMRIYERFSQAIGSAIKENRRPASIHKIQPSSARERERKLSLLLIPTSIGWLGSFRFHPDWMCDGRAQISQRLIESKE